MTGSKSSDKSLEDQIADMTIEKISAHGQISDQVSDRVAELLVSGRFSEKALMAALQDVEGDSDETE